MSPVYEIEEDPKIFTEIVKKIEKSAKIFTENSKTNKTGPETPSRMSTKTATVGTPKSSRKLLEEIGTPKSSRKLIEEAGTPKSSRKLLEEIGTPKSSRKLLEEIGTPKNSWKLLEEIGTPKRSNKEEQSMTTPTRSSRRQSIVPSSVVAADLTPSRRSRNQGIAPLISADLTPSRSSRRQSIVPKRYREDGGSSGDDFEQKMTYQKPSAKKAKIENEISTPNKSGKTSKSSSNKSTPKVEEKTSRPKRRATLAKELVESESSEDETLTKMYRGKRPKDSEFKLSEKEVRKTSIKSKDQSDHAMSPCVKRSTKKKSKKFLSESDGDDDEQVSEDDEAEASPQKGRRSKIVKKSVPNTPKSTTKKRSTMTPRIPDRRIKLADSMSPLQEAQLRLHVAAVPDNLPCRENEFAEIFSFTESKIQDGIGGCMYISGVPGIFCSF